MKWPRAGSRIPALTQIYRAAVDAGRTCDYRLPTQQLHVRSSYKHGQKDSDSKVDRQPLRVGARETRKVHLVTGLSAHWLKSMKYCANPKTCSSTHSHSVHTSTLIYDGTNKVHGAVSLKNALRGLHVETLML